MSTSRQQSQQPTFAHCAGPCDQGRKLCPCPDACRTTPQRRKKDPGYVEPGYIGQGAYLPVLLAIALAAAVCFGRMLFN